MDVQGGGVERVIYRCKDSKERSCNRIPASRGAVLGVVVDFDAFVRWSISQSPRVVKNAVEEYGI